MKLVGTCDVVCENLGNGHSRFLHFGACSPFSILCMRRKMLGRVGACEGVCVVKRWGVGACEVCRETLGGRRMP